VKGLEKEFCFRIQTNIPKGYYMSQVQFKATFEVAPGTVGSSLAVAPPLEDFPDLQVGVATDGTPVATVTGGVPPYQYALDPNSDPMPPGVNFAEDGNGDITLAGTPTTAGDYGNVNGVLLDITDSAGNTAQLKRGAAKVIGKTNVGNTGVKTIK
jgi:hypothetical protein